MMVDTTFDPSLVRLVCESYEGDVAGPLFHGRGRARFSGGHTYEVCLRVYVCMCVRVCVCV